MEGNGATLQHRLMSCLETILELEGELENLEQGHALLSEFNQLKSFMENIDQVILDEYDVKRIENATENFLEEIKGPINMMGAGRPHKKTIQ
jgi:hypothetical protein